MSYAQQLRQAGRREGGRGGEEGKRQGTVKVIEGMLSVASRCPGWCGTNGRHGASCRRPPATPPARPPQCSACGRQERNSRSRKPRYRRRQPQNEPVMGLQRGAPSPVRDLQRPRSNLTPPSSRPLGQHKKRPGGSASWTPAGGKEVRIHEVSSRYRASVRATRKPRS